MVLPPVLFIMLFLPCNCAAASTVKVPLVTISSPMLRPSMISTCVPFFWPSVTSRISKMGLSCAAFTYTKERSPVQSTALAGMLIAFVVDCAVVIFPLTNIPGFNTLSLFLTVARRVAVRVSLLSRGVMKLMVPSNFLLRYAEV